MFIFYQFFVLIKTGMMYRPTGKYFVTLPSFSCTACLLCCLLPVLPCCRSGMNIATALAPSISCISLTSPPIIVQFLVQHPNTHICHRKKQKPTILPWSAANNLHAPAIFYDVYCCFFIEYILSQGSTTFGSRIY